AGLYIWLLLIVSSFREMILVQKKAVEGAYAEYAEVMQLSLTGFFVSAFFLSRTYNEVLFILIALSTLISVFSRKRFDYKVHLLDSSLLISTLVFMVLLIVVIKILVMI
ncbi:MAG: hypothetical protein KOO63_02540, partial [Bacteroidales bacterium]|nr:hypothetical protein [Candidatus Latescibacterota bacterium]